MHALISKSKTGNENLSLRHILLAGGFDKTEQYKALKVGVDLAVCNPGRLIDLATMKGMEDVLQKVVVAVVDEADKMVRTKDQQASPPWCLHVVRAKASAFKACRERKIES